MSERIEKYDIVSKQAIETIEVLLHQIELLHENFKQIKSMKEYSTAVNDVRTKAAKLTTEQQELLKIQQAYAKELTKGNVIYQQTAAATDKLKNQNRLLKNELGATRGSVNALAAENNKLIAKYKALDQSTKEGRREAKLLGQQIKQNTDQLKKYDAQLGNHQRNVGNYPKILESVRAKYIAVAAGIAVFGRAIGKVVGIVSDFEEGMSKVKALTGASGKELEGLRKQALKLGATTSKSATQVTELQQELAKLGFSTSEILAASEGIIKLAEATDEDLAKSASVAGNIIRAMGLDASQTSHVVDVMAESFNKTALDLESFGEAFKYVGPIAKAAGVSVEEVSAMLGALSDAGIKGSMAGTSLRMILNQMAKTGKPAAEAIKQLAAQGLDLAGAEEEVGKNAQTALLVLADQTKKVDDLTKSFLDCDGSAQTMADTMRDNLKGDIEKLRSTWEAFILSLNEGSGVISGVSRKLVQMFTNALIQVQNLDLIMKSTKKYTLDDWVRTYETLNTLTNKQGQNFQALRKELDKVELSKLLNSDYVADEFAKNLDELDSNINYDDALEIYKVYLRKRQEAQDKADFEAMAAKLREIKNMLTTGQDMLTEAEKSGIIIEIKKDIEALEKAKEEAFSTDAIENYNIQIEELQQQLDELNNLGLNQTTGLINQINERIAFFEKQKKESYNVTEIRQFNSEIAKLKELLDLIENPVEKMDGALIGLPNPTLEDRKKAVIAPKIDKPEDSLLDKLIGTDAESRQATKDKLQEFAEAFKDFAQNFNQAAIEDAENQIKISQGKIDNLKSELEEQRQLQAEGKANSVAIIEDKIARERAIEQKALKERQKLQKQQEAINTAAEVSSLITASANILKGWSEIPLVGQVLGIAAIATMLATFIAKKTQIKSQAKTQAFAEGTEYVELNGNPRGKDTIPAFLDEGERVLKADLNKELAGISNEDLVKYAKIGEAASNWFNNPELLALNRPLVAPVYVNNDYSKLSGKMEDLTEWQRSTYNLLNDRLETALVMGDKILIKKGRTTREIRITRGDINYRN